MAVPEIRLRTASPGLLALPWDLPLAEWMMPEVALRDISVGLSRHLVKFVVADNHLWALKELPPPIAGKEYAVLRQLEDLGIPAVRPAGVVEQPDHQTAILVTHFLEGSWQYRRLFMRLPPDQPSHRARLFDAMATLIVDLHRHGIFWGDCSLANTLFTRDGQLLQAWFVDAETSEHHARLSRGQRQYDLDILIENISMGLIDVADRLDYPEELHHTLITEAHEMQRRYDALWETLTAKPTFGFADRYRVEGTTRKLNELGFVVDEISLQPVSAGTGELRMNVAVGDRRFHAQHLQELTGLDVGEGQARTLLGDLFTYQAQLARETGQDVDARTAAQLWLIEVATPTMHRAHKAVNRVGTPIQAYCDLLEIRWLLSEREGHDVGTERALLTVAGNSVPSGSAAKMAVLDIPTEPFAAFDPEG